ncbi:MULTISPECIES: TlpA family protein disulfide reductase [Pseudomonas]|uniref:TlpA family protein disulfide reductase n=1 Tax=Pseudomonas TaxID=286 RepID=UPI001CF9C555|nr:MULTISPECIES: TlpA family protein disulfide reductase [Pseudomonas]
MLSFNLGPFALSLQHLSLLAAVGLGMAVAWGIERRRPGKRTGESVIFWLFAIALLMARAGFIIQYWPQYHSDPLQAIDLRDGGFLAWPGVVTIVLGTLLIGWRRASLRRPLGWGMSAGLLLWTLVSITTQQLDKDRRLPALHLQNSTGLVVPLADARGRPMVVNLWATWCPPCRREMPVLREAMRDYPQVAFALVNQGESVADVSTFLGTVGIDSSQVLFDPQTALAQQVGSAALPTTLFYSADGRLVGTHLGELSAASLAHALEVFGL